MANELTLNISEVFSLGTVKARDSSSSKINVSSAPFTQQIGTASTTDGTVALGSVSTIGYVQIRSLDISYVANPQAVTSITNATGTATVTTPRAHGYVTGQTVIIAGAAQTQYNGAFAITVTSSTVFTYTVSGSPASPATGTITTTLKQNSLLVGADGTNYPIVLFPGEPFVARWNGSSIHVKAANANTIIQYQYLVFSL